SCRALTRARLAELYGAGTAVPEVLVERLVDHAEGNPFYLEELVNYLHATGMSPSDDKASSVELPESLASLVLSRVDTLAEASRRTLKVASVVGREFSVQTLTGSYPELGTARQVAGSLRRICAAGLVVPGRASAGSYAFKHAVIQEACYETLPFSLRALVHGRVGCYLEATEPEALDLLAHHFWHSQEEEKKREYLARAGDAAEARYANESAVAYFRKLAGLPGTEDKGQVLIKLGRVLELQGTWAESEKAYGEALRLAEEGGDLGTQAWARAHRASPMRRQGRYDEAVAELDAAGRLFGRVGDAAGEGRVAHVRGVIANQRGSPEEAWAHFERSLELRRALGDRRSEATLLDNLSIAAAHQRRYDVAQQLSAEALALRRELADRWGVGVSEANMGMISYLRGDNDGARAHFEAALSAQLEIGDAFSVANARHNLANALRELGDGAAGAHYAEALPTYAGTADRRSLCLLYEDVAMLVARDEPRAALRLLGAADSLRARIGSSRLDYEQEKLDLCLAGARARLGPAAGEEHAAGLALEESTAQELALSLCLEPAQPAAT
ncbi:MAG: ATP-binding protein, partial [Acidimicrobiales bacterium]